MFTVYNKRKLAVTVGSTYLAQIGYAQVMVVVFDYVVGEHVFRVYEISDRSRVHTLPVSAFLKYGYEA